MSEAIWKYALATHGETDIQMPVGARVLAVQQQGGLPTLWAAVHTDAKLSERRFVVVVTGDHVPETIHAYIGTVQIDWYVAHVFELLTAKRKG